MAMSGTNDKTHTLIIIRHNRDLLDAMEVPKKLNHESDNDAVNVQNLLEPPNVPTTTTSTATTSIRIEANARLDEQQLLKLVYLYSTSLISFQLQIDSAISRRFLVPFLSQVTSCASNLKTLCLQTNNCFPLSIDHLEALAPAMMNPTSPPLERLCLPLGTDPRAETCPLKTIGLILANPYSKLKVLSLEIFSWEHLSHDEFLDPLLPALSTNETLETLDVRVRPDIVHVEGRVPAYLTIKGMVQLADLLENHNCTLQQVGFIAFPSPRLYGLPNDPLVQVLQNSITMYLLLNRAGRKRLLKELDDHTAKQDMEWIMAVAQVNENVPAIYYLLSRNLSLMIGGVSR